MNHEVLAQITDFSGDTKTYNDVRSWMTFLKNEAAFWEKKAKELEASGKGVSQLFQYHYQLQSALNTLKSDPRLESSDTNGVQQLINQIAGQQLGNSRSDWLWSGAPETHQYIELASEYGPTTALSFINFVMRKQVDNLSVRDSFIGSLYGYEFFTSSSKISKRRGSERTSLEKLRADLEKTTNLVIGDSERIKSEFKAWTDEGKQAWHDWTDEQKKYHTNFLQEQAGDLVDFGERRSSALQELENLYHEKLRLEKPATYWNKAAKSLRTQGYWVLGTILLLVVLGSAGLASMFAFWLAGHQIPLGVNSIQGITLFATAIAAYAFGLRVLSRIAFSNFHLMRDAEEREQLTHLYLSLGNEKAVDESSRAIVLQALFSRSDTGLLAGDSGPTMPSIADIISPKNN